MSGDYKGESEMNCPEVDQLLDSVEHDALPATHKRAVDEHVASCWDCREAWEAYRRLIATPVPPTPRELRRRVLDALRMAHHWPRVLVMSQRNQRV
jgi:DNA-binding transcriptional regulator PaaX